MFGWPELEARWRELETRDYRFATGIHARVYVAFGSHASYPLPCAASEPAPLDTELDCWQGEYRQDLGPLSVPLPDGRRDGKAAWSMNLDENCSQVACITPLPVSRDGHAARWNAYPGSWGKAECAFGLGVLCVRSSGPFSPSFQDRYKDPGSAPLGTGVARAGVGG
jgi:hypothetical protein